MANKFITMLQSKSILQLLINGKKKSEIAHVVGISLNTVKKYIKQFNKSGLSYQQLLDLPMPDFVSTVYPQKLPSVQTTKSEILQNLLPDYIKRLQETHSTRQTLWQEYRREYPDGYSYSQFCEHIMQSNRKEKVVMHLEHKPGSVLQIDFAGDKLSYINPKNNEIVECPVLVCTMPFSSFCYVEALPDMSQLQLIGALNRCLHYLKGVPVNICSDNLKQVVTKADKYEPVFSELMLQFALHYKTSFTATRIVKPRDKASVERHVGIVYTSIYAYLEQEQYYSIQELNNALQKHLILLNDRIMPARAESRKNLFLQHEFPVLNPLPDEPFDVKFQTSAKVQNNYHVILGKDWHNYSVPYQYVGKKVSIIYDSNNVEIYFNMNLIALHERNCLKNGFSTDIEHCPDNHKTAMTLQQITPDEIISKAKLIGANTEKYINSILDKEFFSIQILKSCTGILNLVNFYDKTRVEKACEIALKGLSFNYKTIKNILENNRDKTTEQSPVKPVTDNLHVNIRGKDFFIKYFNN